MKRYTMRDVTPYATVHPDGDWVRYEDHVAALAQQPQAAPVAQGLTAASISMSRHSRAMLLNVLWHHQGGSSPVGQPIRVLLGIGQHDRLNDEHLAEAKWIDGLLTAPSASAGQAEPVANNEAYDLAYDKIDRFLRSNLDDDDYAEFSRALDSLFAAPAPASPAALTERALIDAANTRADLYEGDDRPCIKTDVMNAFYAGAEFAMSATPPAAEGEHE